MIENGDISAPSARISIQSTQEGLVSKIYENGIAEYYNSDGDFEAYHNSCIEENEIIQTSKDEENKCYIKLLYIDDDTFITASYTESDTFGPESEFVKHIYDTVTVTESYGPGSYNAPEENFYSENIVSNVIISEQAANYANEAIRIIKSFLDFEANGNNATDEMTDLYSRIENYAEQSKYVHDKDIADILSLIEYKFDGNSDHELVDIVDQLQALCSST